MFRPSYMITWAVVLLCHDTGPAPSELQSPPPALEKAVKLLRKTWTVVEPPFSRPKAVLIDEQEGRQTV